MYAKRANTVLLVDDELINIKILSDVLKEEYEIVFATQGEEGIRLALELKPDIILLDIMMPDMDGYEVCTRLQNDARTAAIPIIFVTALGSPVQELKGLETGAIDYVTKPINGDIVKARLRNHLKYKDVILASSLPDQSVDQAVESMTPRQKEVFDWVKLGKTNWEISKILSCSEENVKYHMKNIFRILGSDNRTHAATRHPGRKLS
jgi:DNA-binding NarL/FixJ family response regulator